MKNKKCPLQNFIRQECCLTKESCLPSSEYYAAHNKSQYAHFCFYKNGIEVKISSKPSHRLSDFDIRINDKLMANEGIFFPKFIREAYDIIPGEVFERYKLMKSTFFINKSIVSKINIPHFMIDSIDSADLVINNESEENTFVRNYDGSIDIGTILGPMIVTYDVSERMIIKITKATGSRKERKYVTEDELKDYYGRGMKYMPQTSMTFVTNFNTIPSVVADLFEGSLRCVINSKGEIIGTPIKAICPFTEEKIDYLTEKPKEVCVSENTDKHISEAADIVQFLIEMNEKYSEMEDVIKRLKKSEKRLKKENDFFRKYIALRQENPDNILLSSM